MISGMKYFLLNLNKISRRSNVIEKIILIALDTIYKINNCENMHAPNFLAIHILSNLFH